MRGVTGEALPLLVQHGWRGNVRELEAVLEQAMIFRRGEWITPEDLDLPAPRRNDAGESDGGVGRDGTLEDRVALSWLQHEALRLVAERREPRWRELVARCGISREVARTGAGGAGAAGAGAPGRIRTGHEVRAAVIRLSLMGEVAQSNWAIV